VRARASVGTKIYPLECFVFNTVILSLQISFPTHAQDQLRAMISSMLKEEMAEMEGHRSLAMHPTFDSLEAKVDAQGQALDT
jgi:hypothetical protein